jgi:hypothetical protein
LYETPLGAGRDVYHQRCVKLDIQRFVEFLDAQDHTVGPELPCLRHGFAQKVGFGASFCIFDTMKISILL